jgi:opacity protein-like surface antigen
MKTFLQVAAVAAALMVPFASAQAQQQGSNEAQGYAQSGGYSGGFGGAYAYYGRHHRHWR